MALALSACVIGAGTDQGMPPQTTATTSPLLEIAQDVDEAINDLSLAVAQMDDPDLLIGWSDLSGDVKSAMGDLEQDPTSVDVEGMIARILAFESQYQLEAEPTWRTFASAFETFVLQLPPDGYQ